ncbi:hypothetical protein BC835DRAFT_326238 [Cytidiella melzeri]|nr:hypothetical protein BC835DRAFT_326238 [Cytidiella melzeri]
MLCIAGRRPCQAVRHRLPESVCLARAILPSSVRLPSNRGSRLKRRASRGTSLAGLVGTEKEKGTCCYSQQYQSRHLLPDLPPLLRVDRGRPCALPLALKIRQRYQRVGIRLVLPRFPGIGKENEKSRGLATEERMRRRAGEQDQRGAHPGDASRNPISGRLRLSIASKHPVWFEPQLYDFRGTIERPAQA